MKLYCIIYKIINDSICFHISFLPITHQRSSKVYAELSCLPSIINSEDDVSLRDAKGLSDFKKGDSVPCYVKAVGCVLSHFMLSVSSPFHVIVCVSMTQFYHLTTNVQPRNAILVALIFFIFYASSRCTT